MEWLKNQVIAALSGDQKVSKQLLIALAGVVAVASLVLVAVNRPEPPTGEFSVSADETANEVLQQYLYVHVVGEVQSPGMYQLPIGARLVDAVFAAGGLTEEADNASVNLARELTDGEQIIVFSISQDGESPGTTEAKDSNDASVTMVFRSSKLDLVLLGDLGADGQERVARSVMQIIGSSSNPLVLKVSHHGSNDQSASFHQKLEPDLALISVGSENGYGHPGKQALQILGSVGAQVLRTDLLGAIAVSTTGGKLQWSATGR